MYARRLEYLLQREHGLDEAMNALECTRNDGGYSSMRAEGYLNAKAERERTQTLKKANDALVPTEDMPFISEKSALGYLLAKHDDAVGIVTKLRDLHSKSRAKAAHNAKPALAASYLVETSSVKGDAELTRKGWTFLCSAAAAVSEDCIKCQELRAKLEQEEKAEKERAKVAAEKAKQAEQRKRQALEEAKRQRDHAPHVVNFKVCDSKRDVTLPHGFCGTCDKGAEGGAWLYYCGRCNKGFHVLCMVFTLVRTRAADEFFACRSCLDILDRKLINGDCEPGFEIIGNNILRGKAPVHASAHPEGNQIRPAMAPSARTPAGTGDIRQLFHTPPPPPASNHPPPSSARSGESNDEGRGVTFAESEPNTGSKEKISKTGFQVKDYFMWEPIPKDYTPKVDPKAEGKDGKESLPEHPEKGYGKVAYQNWRRKNVSARDFVAANKGSLGPLTRALSSEMTVTLGRQFMRDPACSAFWPKPVMTGADRDEWARTDPAFKWVKKIPDELLLALCDKRFGVKKNDLFLTKRFHSDLPPTNAKGEVNYHVAEFNRWITDWETELSELQQGGCSFEGINLRQTLINALSPNKMIHDQATVHQTDFVC